MSTIGSYKNTAFSESQKFLVLDPATGSTSLVLGKNLVDYIKPRLNSVIAETTRLAAENTDYKVGEVVQTTGAEAPGDNFAGVYLVVEGGQGDFPMINGNDLLVIRGDDFLREQLASQESGEGASLVSMEGGPTVEEAVNNRVIRVSSRTEMKTYDVPAGYQFSLEEGGRSGFFVVKSGTPPSDPQEGIYVVLDNGNYAERIRGEFVRAAWFGILRDGSDETSKLQAVRDYMASNADESLILDGGRYTYTNSPNWAIQNLKVKTDGEVTFVNTGTGDCLIFDDPTGTTFNIKWCWGDKFFVEGDESTNYGIYWRSCHHSKLSANVRGCGSNFFRSEFAVVNEWDVVCSVNQGPFASSPAPAGMYCTRRNAGEETSANTIYNPIVEGVRGVGITLDYAIMNMFIAGTSEGNAGANVECTANSRKNTFNGIDLELSGSNQGFIDRGRWNEWFEIFNDALSTITSDAVGVKMQGGLVDAISNSGKGTRLIGVAYGADGGEVADLGTETTEEDLYDVTSASFKTINKSKGRITGNFTVTTGAWAAPATVPGTVTKSIGSIPTDIAVGDIVTVAPASNFSGDYIISARVTAANTMEIRITQITGAAASPYPSGVDFEVHVEGQ